MNPEMLDDFAAIAVVAYALAERALAEGDDELLGWSVVLVGALIEIPPPEPGREEVYLGNLAELVEYLTGGLDGISEDQDQ